MLDDASHIPDTIAPLPKRYMREGGKIALQILHTGRYSYQPHLVASLPHCRPPSQPFRSSPTHA
ncbi:hypothetical protein ACLK1S_19120 [Escherichia coli]